MKFLFCSLLVILSQSQTPLSKTVDYLNYPEFANGFTRLLLALWDNPNIPWVLEVYPNKPVDSQPTWQLAQWGTQFLLTPGIFSQEGESIWTIKNQAKRSLYKKKSGLGYLAKLQ
jgi:hypothetical protein